MRLELAHGPAEIGTVDDDRFGIVGRPPVRGMEGIATRESPALSEDMEFYESRVCLAWVEADTGYRMCATADTEAMLLSVDELVRIADGLR